MGDRVPSRGDRRAPSGRGVATTPPLSEDEIRRRVASAPVAILGTINPDGSVHLVPITFALVGETLYSAVDHKPKSTRSLKRLDNVRRDPRVTLLVEHHEEDWSALWWCRLDGNAIVSKSRDAEGLSALTSKYPDYVKRPPDGPWLRVQIEAATGWAATA